mmetsp:Transcript_78999/g.218661  ORF Transcript_78999/g.218661 Transcript_78999/m.218661 type:complete len:190 (-) Transcript_78999:222-791(-)
MLIPLPAMPQAMGPPSPFLVRMKKWMFLMLILQSGVCLVRFICTDIWAGFIMAIIIGLGWYAWYRDMNITFICYWGLLGLIHGIFDLVRLIDFEVKSRYPLFSKDASLMFNLNSASRLFGPIVILLGSLMAWFLYRYDLPDPAYDRLGQSDWQDDRSSRTPLTSSRVLGGRAPGGGFQTFSGEGHRLGS